jgi:hypothetical protein
MALLATLAASAASLLVSWPAAIAIAWTAAAALVALWLAHGWMFALRALRAVPGRSASHATPCDGRRRDFIAALLRVLIFTAVTSSLVKPLGAQGCNCYSDQDCGCPADFPQCVFNPTTGEAICCGYDAVGCAGPQITWCCPPNTKLLRHGSPMLLQQLTLDASMRPTA